MRQEPHRGFDILELIQTNRSRRETWRGAAAQWEADNGAHAAILLDEACLPAEGQFGIVRLSDFAAAVPPWEHGLPMDRLLPAVTAHRPGENPAIYLVLVKVEGRLWKALEMGPD